MRRAAKIARVHHAPFRSEIVGTPPSKKNSRVMNWKRHLSLPSEEYQGWIESARLQLRVAFSGRESFKSPVRVEATFYRDLRADLDNLMASLGDALQLAHVIHNDRLIRQWDARLVADGSRPRIEFEIQEIA